MSTIELQSGPGPRQLTDGEYRFWRGDSGRIRWAKINWHDDGLGIASHGSSTTIEGAVQAAHDNRTLRNACLEEIS